MFSSVTSSSNTNTCISFLACLLAYLLFIAQELFVLVGLPVIMFSAGVSFQNLQSIYQHFYYYRFRSVNCLVVGYFLKDEL